jgi:two-component system NarL family sensor kinase
MGRLDESTTTATAPISRAARRAAAPDSRSNHRRLAPDEDALYRAYFENTSEGLFIIDVEADGGFVFRELNPVLEELTGLPTASLQGRAPHECLRQEIADEVEANYRRCVETGTTIRYEERLDLPGGTRDWQTSLTPVRDKSGRIIRILGAARDITDQKSRARQLEESRGLLQSVLNSITECYYTLDRDYNITAINAAAAAWLGVAPEAVVGRSYWDVLSPTTPCGAVVRQAAANGRVFHRELQSIARPGRWLDYHVYPSPSGLSIFFRDITDEVATRKQIEHAAMLLQGTIDALPARVAVLDEFGVITAVNRAWNDLADIRGYRSACCRVGESYVDFCKKLGATARNAFLIARRLEQLLAGRVRQGRHLYSCDTRDGTRWYQMRASRFEVAGANRAVVTHEDVTDVRRADAAQRESGTQLLHTVEEERRRIARELHDSTAQHLTAVGLQLSCLLRMGSGLGINDFVEDARESLLEAQREIRTLSYLLHPPVTGAESLVSAARRFIEGFELRTGLNATLRHVDDPLPPLSADRGAALFRVLQEALANVHKHAGATTVDVSLRHSRDIVALDVKDDGAGFDIVDWDPGSHAHIVFGVGIPGMRARMKQYEGDLTIRRARRGTMLRAWLTAGDIDHAA